MPQLVIVGGGTDRAGYPSYACYALVAGARTYLLDCGEGTTGRLRNLGIDLLSVRAVFVSHMHFDHMAGLFSFLYIVWAASLRGEDVPEPIRGWLSLRGVPDSALPESLTVALPAEGVRPFEEFLPATYLAPEVWRYPLRIVPIEEGLFYEDDVLRASARHTGHLDTDICIDEMRRLYPQLRCQANSLIVEIEGTRVVYSGDLALLGMEQFRRAAEIADVIITEVCHVPPEDHLTMLAGTGARLIVLVHIHPNLNDRIVGWLAAHPDPRFVWAENGMRFDL